MSLTREGYEAANGRVNFFAHSVRSIQIVGSDVFPNVIEVCICLRMKDKLI